MLPVSSDTSPHYFRGDLPDDVPMASMDAIRAMACGFDADRLEVMVIETGDDPGFYVTALVFLNRGRDDGYYFRGLVGPEGFHTPYPRAKDVVAALRKVADESRLQLAFFASGEGARLACEPDNFFAQLKNEHVSWAKNDEPRSADSSCIPYGNRCADCRYAQRAPGKPGQRDGYCAYLDLGDWMIKLGFSLLWDGVKECHINVD